MNLMESYGIKTFNDLAMKKYLPQDTYKKLKNIIKNGHRLEKDYAHVIAHGLKEWALSNNVTHFTHWFHPIRGVTAEKHDTFLSLLDNGEFIERFSSSELIQGETDASSFPSGGVRSTFEARGYTVWDPSSPVFILGDTMCIPSIFLSYNGDSLDKKMPLLTSSDYVEKQAYKLLKSFGNRTVKDVETTVGAEQEYFLVDEKYNRIDIALTGRTLIGCESPKGQVLEDHYFGSIKNRVLNFMKDLEKQFFNLGIPIKTRHNEVAPNQYEFAPIFENANIASDHNALCMELMKKVAKNHKLIVLFHEKPYKGVNGSGKHINWSLMDSDRNNLLSPGNSIKKKLRFLTFLTAIIRGVAKYEKLLKWTALSYSNEERLGGNEAPPTIISMFIGNALHDLLGKIKTSKKFEDLPEKYITTNLSKIPEIKVDSSDRNRTSPFAYTGNKFEFRMPGSSFSVSEITTTINTVIGQGIKEIRIDIEKYLKKDNDIEKAVYSIVKQNLIKYDYILFEGDCYNKTWIDEAKKRGLSISSNYFEVLKEIHDDKSFNCFLDNKIYSNQYLLGLLEIKRDQYINSFIVESKVIIQMVRQNIVPVAIKQLEVYKNYTLNINELLQMNGNMGENTIYNLYGYALAELNDAIINYSVEIENFENSSKEEKENQLYGLKDEMEHIRTLCDQLEEYTEEKRWPFPNYSKLLFDI